MSNQDLHTEIELLKRDVSEMKLIYSRLDKAIEKISDVSNSINRMLAVHEEKISQQEEVQIRSEQEINNDIKELHSRISTNTRELMNLMSEQHKEQTEAMLKLKNELQNRVGVLEKWRWLIIGGSIVVGLCDSCILNKNIYYWHLHNYLSLEKKVITFLTFVVLIVETLKNQKLKLVDLFLLKKTNLYINVITVQKVHLFRTF